LCTQSAKESTLKTAITIGNFDAVHVGHVALVERARVAVGDAGRVEVWSFDPPPVTILNPNFRTDALTTFDQRSRRLLEVGADKVRKITPSKALLYQSPESFIADVVAESSPDFIVEGTQFQFGKDRKGTSETLRAIGLNSGFEYIEIDGVEVTLSTGETLRASSSMVRELLSKGCVEEASRMLGRAYEISGIVTSGDKRGREMGVPTANVSQIATMLPKDGIYAGTATVDNKLYIAAISIGTKPTFGENKRVFEAHLISFDGDLNHYEWPLTVTISSRIREQIKFNSMDELRLQIFSDIETATRLIESKR